MMTTTPYSNVKPGIYTLLEVNPDGFRSSLSDYDSNGNDGDSVNLQGRQAKKKISMAAVTGEV